MKTRLGRKWRRKLQKTKKDVHQETQTSLSELPLVIMKDDEQVQVEEVAIKVITPTKVSKKRKKKKPVLKTVETITTPTRISAVEKVRAAIEAKKHAEIVDTLTTARRDSFKLEVKDSLIKHRRSLIPKIEEVEEEEEEPKELEAKKSRLSLTRDSVELARESFIARTAIKRAQESKLSLARDSVEIIRVSMV